MASNDYSNRDDLSFRESVVLKRTEQREHGLCHPDEASNASGRKDLGQLRASEAGTGF
jgi:hypothetical protein